MVEMKDTVEHHLEMFGLQTLEMRSGMFLYAWRTFPSSAGS
ncbi:hypothetical protein PR003_g12822 [Phytophthora rubi]|uniref:Uncharacterized protein n=2 Tax=Phytophthora TaxID=4783 RepID=A0A6A3LI04_9STRA|nr:hypothetical protein PF003_g29245 [Phytophthora fragariae]KAE9019002.1 hypothetical protein PF011_g6007 [Phytophthora fragariae]KAE9148894.1 hypothetical protein PF006_g6566 [Phytophthora fragariae]KAE9335817.1 hypothetical protein PR003_g12822 [Phytophthora rubi]